MLKRIPILLQKTNSFKMRVRFQNLIEFHSSSFSNHISYKRLDGVIWILKIQIYSKYILKYDDVFRKHFIHCNTYKRLANAYGVTKKIE